MFPINLSGLGLTEHTLDGHDFVANPASLETTAIRYLDFPNDVEREEDQVN